MEVTLEKSQQQADIIQIIQMHLEVLDIEYLEFALDDMEKNHSFRESAAVLDPDPFTHCERQELNGLKLKQFRLFIDLRKNMDAIREAGKNLKAAKTNSGQLRDMFDV